jgi:hypothetical protein
MSMPSPVLFRDPDARGARGIVTGRPEAPRAWGAAPTARPGMTNRKDPADRMNPIGSQPHSAAGSTGAPSTERLHTEIVENANPPTEIRRRVADARDTSRA